MARITFDTTKLKQQVEDNPLFAAGVAAGLLGGAAKLLDANTKRQNAKTWRREVKRREKQK